MATPAVLSRVAEPAPRIGRIAVFPRMRALAWDGDVLYASHGYTLLKTRATAGAFDWIPAGTYQPPGWRNATSQSRLTYRLFRDGFHALAVHPQGSLIAAVPGAIVTLRQGDSDFRVSHRLLRGTRPLHIAVASNGWLYWGEYFDNAARGEVHIYASMDGGLSWHAAYTFPEGSIRHVHNIVFDQWENCLWFLTGDYGQECKILKASLDCSTVEEVLSGNQQARAVAVVVDQNGLFLASDTPLEQNYIYHLDRQGVVRRCGELPSSSIYGGRTRGGIFFSTMIEPSEANPSREVTLFGSSDGERWESLASWRKDHWPMKYFQYGNAILPDGQNSTDLLAISTIAVQGADLETSIWKVV